MLLFLILKRQILTSEQKGRQEKVLCFHSPFPGIVLSVRRRHRVCEAYVPISRFLLRSVKKYHYCMLGCPDGTADCSVQSAYLVTPPYRPRVSTTYKFLASRFINFFIINFCVLFAVYTHILDLIISLIRKLLKQ